MVVGGSPSPTLTPGAIERRRELIVDYWRWACGWPEASEVGERHPRYVEVTEGRDTGPVYSSCRDLAHAGLFRVGVREPWILRAEHRGFVYGRPVVTAGMVPWSGIVEAGDVLVVARDWPRGRDAHVVCVLEAEAERLITAEYGQPGGALKSYPLRDELRGRRVRVRLPFVEAIRTAFHRGLLVEPDWPRDPAPDTLPTGIDPAVVAEPYDPPQEDWATREDVIRK